MIRLKYFFLAIVILFFTISCKRDYRSIETKPIAEDTFTEKYSKIGHVSFYIENSGSMFGYLDGKFTNVVNNLAQFGNLVFDEIPYNYYLINGKKK